MDFTQERKRFIDHMDYLQSMSVQEQTLWKKYKEIKSMKIQSRMDDFEGYEDVIWKPTDINNVEQTLQEIDNLQPRVYAAGDQSEWNFFRRMISTMEYNSNVGRCRKYWVMDDVTEKILGVISLGSDVPSLAVRDQYIGWTHDNRFKDGKLRNVAIGTSIVPTQPLGFNFLGGKLIASLATSSTVREDWEAHYGDVLVGVTTTSLYGKNSMYCGIPHWKVLGESAGKISIKPDDDVYRVWLNDIRVNDRELYNKCILNTNGTVKSGPKQNLLRQIFKKVGVRPTDYNHGFMRGVFFANIYDNGCDFLRGEIDETDLVMKQKFIDDYDYTVSWWKRKAKNRYQSVVKNNRVNNDTLYYKDVSQMDWESVKEKYLGDVGR